MNEEARKAIEVITDFLNCKGQDCYKCAANKSMDCRALAAKAYLKLGHYLYKDGAGV